MKLSAVQVAKAKPRKKDYKLFDGEGLYLLVKKNGSKLWRLKYRFTRKEKTFSFGSFNDVSLQEARALKQIARNLLAKGIDPSEHKKAIQAKKIEEEKNTFREVALEYLNIKKQTLRPRTIEGTLGRWNLHIFPIIGDTPIKKIELKKLLGVFEKMRNGGIFEPIRKALNEVKCIFVYAVQTGKLEIGENPAIYLTRGIVPRRKTKHMAALTSPEDVKGLLEKIYTYKSQGIPIVENALKLLPLVFVRVGELREVKWADIDFTRNEWRFNTDKTDTEIIVPLSRQAMNILQDVHIFTGKYDFVFPGARDKSKSMSNNAIRKALQSLGYSGGQMTGHGFRALARTMLEEELKYPYKFIEPQLSHIVRDPLGRAYNRTTHLEMRRNMMQNWSDFLEELRTSENPDFVKLSKKYQFKGIE